MRIGTTHGTVTLSRCHPSFQGARLRLATPMTLEELREKQPPAGDTLVVWDPLGAGNSALIAISEGGEAAQPFKPDIKPVDAYCAAIVDQINLK